MEESVEVFPLDYDLTEYVNDVNRQYTQVLTEETNKRVQTSYTYGNTRESGNSIWEDSRDCIANMTSYYQYNGHGDVTSRTNDDGMVTNVYQYTPFGQVTLGSAAYEGFYAYGGESYNPNTGLEYLRARYYDTGNGNFLTEDTYLGNLIDPLTQNRYSYVKNNPVNYVDPSGHRLQTPVQRVSTSKKGSNKKTGSVKTSRNSSTSSKPASSKKGAAITTAKTVTKVPAPKVTKAPNHSGGKASGGNRASTSQDNPSPAPAPTISRHLKENASPQIPAVTKHTVEEVSGWAKAKESVAGCADDAWKTIKRTAKSVVEGAWNVVGGIGTQVLYTAGSIPATALNLFSLGVRQTRSGLEIYQKWDAVETWKKMVFEDLSPAMGFDTQSIAFNAGRIATAIDLAFTGIGSMFSGLGTGAVVLAGEGAIETVVVIENGAAIVVGDIILVNNLKSGVEILQSNSRSKREEKKKNNKKEASKNGPAPVKEPVKASNGLYYQSNTKHTRGLLGNRADAGIEPSNALELFENSVQSSIKPGVRFAYDELTGTLHRFFNDGNGVWHWSGSTNQGRNSLTGDEIPIDIKRLFNLRRKGW